MDFLVAFFEDKQVKKAALENGIGGKDLSTIHFDFNYNDPMVFFLDVI